MSRLLRNDVGDYVYHVLNRANARVQIFDNNNDYEQFEHILDEAVEKYDMRLLAYCIMPNHWHLLLHPKNDGDMSVFMRWLTNTHTRRWHIEKIRLDKAISIKVVINLFFAKMTTIFLPWRDT